MKAQSVFTLVSLRNAVHVFLTPVCAYEHTHVHNPLLPFLNLILQLQLYLTARGICKSLIHFFKSLWPCGLNGAVTNGKTAAAAFSILKHQSTSFNPETSKNTPEVLQGINPQGLKLTMGRSLAADRKDGIPIYAEFALTLW